MGGVISHTSFHEGFHLFLGYFADSDVHSDRTQESSRASVRMLEKCLSTKIFRLLAYLLTGLMNHLQTY